MKYLCLAYGDTARWHALYPHDQVAVAREAARQDEQLRRLGHFIAMDDFLPVRAAGAVRVRGRSLMTDTVLPVPDGQLGGFYLIRARDLNDAIRIAAKTSVGYLGYRLGWELEVRNVTERWHLANVTDR